jgi:hypothetical protein
MDESHDVEALVEGLIKKNNLTSLMDEESKLYRQVRMLNSEFHTLLYENYNKLISAAQIIGQMSSNFDHMEDNINSLSDNMSRIIDQSDHLSANLSEKFKRLSRLSKTYSNLKRLQFMSDLEDLVVSSGQYLSKNLMESFEDENWMTDQRPRHVRPVIIKMIEDLSEMSDVLAQYCEEGPHVESNGQPSLYHNNRVNNPLMNNIKKLFAEKIDIFQPVPLKRRTILFGVSKIMLRTMVECVRLQTFNKNGLQQIQIDAKYLQHELTRFVSDENVIFALLDEVVTSAEIRCVEDDIITK